jgi:hypothetical protein
MNVTQTGWNSFIIKQKSGTTRCMVNNGLVAGNTGASGTCSKIGIGATGANNNADFEIAFLIVYDGYMDEADMLRLNYYMDQRFFDGRNMCLDPDNPPDLLETGDGNQPDPPTNRHFLKAAGQPILGGSTPAGANDGLDPIGFGLVNATYDHTGNAEGERHLSLTAAFTNYEHVPGDMIYLMNAVGGVATGLYTIASKVDADAILLASSAGLTADSTADVDSSSGPWSNAQNSFDALIAGEVLCVCRDQYIGRGQSNPIEIDITAGTATAPITVRGVNARGGNDGTLMRWYGDSLVTVTDPIFHDNAGSIVYWNWENHDFDHNAS